MQKKALSGFTLVEVLIGILIVAIVLISGFSAYSIVTVGKIKLIESANLQKDSYFFLENLFQEIKAGGTLDYEEYFNRKMLNAGKTDLYSSGHYKIESGFGNFGSGGIVFTTTPAYYGGKPYLCRSGSGSLDADIMGTGTVTDDSIWCYGNSNFRNDATSQSGTHQRYGQYRLQFIDYNSDHNGDEGDQDGNGDIRGDNDDEDMGKGPEAFSGGNLHELYLISGDGKRRTFFRWNIVRDEEAPSGKDCTGITDGTNMQEYCRGEIQFLRLDGTDEGLDHNINQLDSTQFDGKIDTWKIAEGFAGAGNVAGSGATVEWKNISPKDLNVTDFKVYAYPNIDPKGSWAMNEAQYRVAPYVRILVKVKPGWAIKKKIKTGKERESTFSTTINLTDIFSN